MKQADCRYMTRAAVESCRARSTRGANDSSQKPPARNTLGTLLRLQHDGLFGRTKQIAEVQVYQTTNSLSKAG